MDIVVASTLLHLAIIDQGEQLSTREVRVRYCVRATVCLDGLCDDGVTGDGDASTEILVC